MKILIVIIAFFIAATSYSQFTAVPLRLVNSDGSPNTGESANIKFTKYPHSYPTDIIGSITVTEIGTAGNYIAKGFTTFQYAKLWLSGVEQTWFDSVLTGNIFTYLQSNYGRLGSSNTWIGALNTFDGASFGGQVTLEDLTTVFNVEYSTESDLYLWAATPNNNTVIWKRYADSLYGNGGKFFYTGGKLYLHSGIKLWGLGNTQPIQINTGHFNWNTTNGLELDYPVQFDSLSIQQDTIISENTYYKIWSIHRNKWSEIDSLRLWMTYYNTFANTRDSFQVINEAVQLSENLFTVTVDSAAISDIDTFALPQVGLWEVKVSYEYEFEYVTPNNSGYDSLFIAIYEGDTYDLEFAKDYTVHKVAFNSGVPFGFRSRGELRFTKKVNPDNLGNAYYIAGRTSGICHTSGGSAKVWVKRLKIDILKVR